MLERISIPPIISAEQLQAVQERRKRSCTATPLLPAQAELYKLCGSTVPGSAAKRICKGIESSDRRSAADQHGGILHL